MRRFNLWARLLLCCLCVAVSSCRSSGIDVTIQNNATVPIRNVEVDYPGAVFGTPVISPGKSFWYHIKPLNDGDLSVSFELENGKSIKQKGPAVKAGYRGTMTLIVEQDPRQQWRVRALTTSGS
jgi:hypothetical protein